ncbi:MULTISPECIES: TadE/TadG family type IV pilus assembly protein [unclassified Bordetella]|uniref:TadE/TadG family type IV pilus assembly protein n=1 Tax=unclassified Bordetella TaxID=2630031 RepID=UPI001329DDF2|nr:MULTISPECIES: TadE/TadG family type IV pilus assembly protein [unclassified Bordetella]MVW70565.1 pilus assembly protein [Bordetella sp. 15P40C-2]MVW79773.1 pilus assembly protein [Bordetella sp. 02P26C-1]
MEFALVVTTLVLIVTALIGYGALFWAKQHLSAAAGEGARAGLHASYSGRDNVQAASCEVAANVFGTASAVQCTATPQPCQWLGAGGMVAECIAVALSYDVAQWPMLESFKQLLRFAAGEHAESWIPSRLVARAIIQIKQDPL